MHKRTCFSLWALSKKEKFELVFLYIRTDVTSIINNEYYDVRLIYVPYKHPHLQDKNDVCLVYAFHPTKDAFTYHDLAYHGLKSNRGHMTVCDINILGPPVPPTKAPSSSAETRAFLPVILFGFIMGMLLPVSYWYVKLQLPQSVCY